MSDSTPSRSGSLLGALAQIQDLLLDATGPLAVLHTTALLMTTLLPVRVGCALVMAADRERATVGGSSARITRLRQLETAQGDGPSLAALARGVAITIDDVAADQRWVPLCGRLRTQGVGSLVAMPVQVAGRTVAVATLYIPRHQRLLETHVRGVVALGQAAATTLLVREGVEEQRLLNEQLQQAAVSRPVIDQAMGIVMVLHGCRASEAFTLLRERSQSANQPVRKIAADLVAAATGRPPEPARPFVQRGPRPPQT
jgi:GAF domain-containing protein